MNKILKLTQSFDNAEYKTAYIADKLSRKKRMEKKNDGDVEPRPHPRRKYLLRQPSSMAIRGGRSTTQGRNNLPYNAWK